MIPQIKFSNPAKKPIGELFFNIKEDGVLLKIPALSDRWIQKRSYARYRPIVLEGDKFLTGVELDEWLMDAEWFNEDMEHLLKLRHYQFWSHLVYEKSCMESVISFLQEATPYYIFNNPQVEINDRARNIYKRILQNVLRIICRMITNKETPEEWITNEHLGELLYSKFLISIPMIFDLITTYGRANINILMKITQTIFKIEPKYNDDLRIGLKYLQTAFGIIQRKTETEGMENGEGPNLSFDDLTMYTLDCACVLSILLEVYPDARKICLDIQLEQKLAHFYDNAIPLLYTNIFTIDPHSTSLKYLNYSRMEFLKAFRSMIYLHIEDILKNPNESLLSSESYIAILTECLTHRTFVVDYQKNYPVENDIDILKQACKELDNFKTDFVLNGYTSECASYLIDMVGKSSHPREEVPMETIINGFHQEEEIEPSTSKQYRDIEKEVLIVQDVLSHLGDGFIRRLLPRYDNPEQAIAAVLEGNLPPDLQEADQAEVYIPPDPKDSLYLQTGIDRLNVFDGDEYDIMTQDNPKCIIKTTKEFPNQPKTVNELLDDKSHVKELRDRYKSYDLISDNEYGDEYDDSYEALAESESKSTAAIKKTVKDVLLDEVSDKESEESEYEISSDNDNSAANNTRDKSKDFVENPEDVRARYEARRNAKFASKSWKNPKLQQKSTDVVGKPKGQGQDKETKITRHKKDVHKSSRANHNRKSEATWKRNKGMISTFK